MNGLILYNNCNLRLHPHHFSCSICQHTIYCYIWRLVKNFSSIALIFCTLLVSCTSKVAKKNDEPTQTSNRISSFNSVIKGKVVELTKPNTDFPLSSPCRTNPCKARIEILSIENKGQNYHDQFHVSDTLEIDFTYTLSPTRDIFPELNEHLPGLKKGEQLVAELFEHPDTDRPYRIKIYEVKH